MRKSKPASLPVYRSKKASKPKYPPPKLSNASIAWIGSAATALFILILFCIGAPARQARHSNTAAYIDGTADGNWLSNLAFVGGTDKYFPIREEEIRGNWDSRMGLEIDAWDPRTHDPRNNYSRIGTEVSMKLQENRYFLSAVIYNRVFREDKFNISGFELRQWVEYMKYAGVGHIFWYDTAHSSEESQEYILRQYVKKGFLTYHKFHDLFPDTLDAGYNYEQDQSVIHAIESYGGQTKWLLAVDIDEYIFLPSDQSPGFLDRYMREYSEDFPEVSQTLMQCMFFLGQPQKKWPHLLIERYQLRKAETEGVSLLPASRMKAIIKPDHVKRVYTKNPHMFEMKAGKTVALPAGSVRLNHYHGPRGLNQSVEFLSSLVEDGSIQPIADELRRVVKPPWRPFITH